MTAVGSTRLVAAREIRETTRRKSFWIVLVVLALAATAAVVVPTLLDDDGTRYRVAVVGDRAGLGEALTTSLAGLDATVRTSSVATAADAERRVEDGSADLAVVAGDRARLIVKAGEHQELVGAASQALSTIGFAADLEADGVDAARITDLLSRPAPTVTEIDRGAADRKGASFAITLVLYILLLTLMVQAANGTAIEKSNRISEVLLAIVRPGPLLFGKVIGISVTGLLTFAAGGIPIVVSLAIGSDLPPGIGGALAGGAIWFVLGMVLFLTLAGALGSLAERQEEAGVVVAPLTFLLVGTFIAAQSAADTTFGIVLALVPLTSPLVMPARIAEGVATVPEMAASALLLIAAIALVARFGAVVYGRAIVRTGRRLKLKEVLRSTPA
ncbi:MAG: ABC transporter permease [Microthrixaceae bacterium]|jgi:ABC-2 type transport system permease protein|nr:ABC transporter permease [Microthrixaceae bacterium]